MSSKLNHNIDADDTFQNGPESDLKAQLIRSNKASDLVLIDLSDQSRPIHSHVKINQLQSKYLRSLAIENDVVKPQYLTTPVRSQSNSK